jgi:hypothetical protein
VDLARVPACQGAEGEEPRQILVAGRRFQKEIWLRYFYGGTSSATADADSCRNSWFNLFTIADNNSKKRQKML